jgi:hypothetical protein
MGLKSVDISYFSDLSSACCMHIIYCWQHRQPHSDPCFLDLLSHLMVPQATPTVWAQVGDMPWHPHLYPSPDMWRMSKWGDIIMPHAPPPRRSIEGTRVSRARLSSGHSHIKCECRPSCPCTITSLTRCGPWPVIQCRREGATCQPLT